MFQERKRQFTPAKFRPVSTKSKVCGTSSSRKSFASKGKKKSFLPYQYYHDRTLAFISGKIDSEL